MKFALERLAELAGRLRTTEWQVIVDSYVDEAARITGSKLGYFAFMSWNEDELTMMGWSKTAMADCALISKPIKYELVQTGLWGDCVRQRKPVVTNDYKSSVSPTKKGYPKGHVEVVRHMNVPIFEGPKIRGVLGVGNKGIDYSQSDADMLQQFANEAWNSVKKILAL